MTKVMETGHSPFLSRPEEVKDIFDRVVIKLTQFVYYEASRPK